MADTSVKLSGTYDSIEAYNILEEMRNMSADYEEIRTEAAAAASAATAASTAATNAVNTANTAVANAQTYAGNANTSAGEAAGYASDASTSATNAASSETNASNSASAAATSAANAAASEAVVAGALPLSGGTMTGKILGTSAVLGNANDTDKMFILGGTSTTDSPSIMMSPKNGENGGVIQLQARNGSTFVNLNAFSNGSLTWGGNEVVTKKAENISSSVTVTTNNGTVTEKFFYKVGNVVECYLVFKISTQVTAGSSISGNITGLPARLTGVANVTGIGFYGGSALVLAFNSSNSYNIRVIGSTLGAGSEFSVTFMYATVS